MIPSLSDILTILVTYLMQKMPNLAVKMSPSRPQNTAWPHRTLPDLTGHCRTSPHRTLPDLTEHCRSHRYTYHACGAYLHEKLGGLEEILPVDPRSTVLHHLVLDTWLDLCQRLLFQLQTLCMILPLQHDNANCTSSSRCHIIHGKNSMPSANKCVFSPFLNCPVHVLGAGVKTDTVLLLQSFCHSVAVSDYWVLGSR